MYNELPGTSQNLALACASFIRGDSPCYLKLYCRYANLKRGRRCKNAPAPFFNLGALIVLAAWTFVAVSVWCPRLEPPKQNAPDVWV